MALPTWPAGVPYAPQRDSLRDIEPSLKPIETEMEQGNMRRRRRPGDNVGTLPQVIRMTFAQYQTFDSWRKGTLGGGTGRFTADVWLGAAFDSKVCQFVGAAPKPNYIDDDIIDVAMTLRVFNY